MFVKPMSHRPRKRKTSALRIKHRKKTKNDVRLCDYVNKGDKVRLSSTNKKYLVKHVSSSSVLLKCLELSRLGQNDINEVYCVIVDGKIRGKYSTTEITVIKEETWRELLDVGSTVHYYRQDTVYQSVVLSKNGNMLTIQPFGSDMRIILHRDSFCIDESVHKIDECFEEIPKKNHHKLMYNTIAANDQSWRGVVVDTDVEFGICLIRKYGRDVNYARGNDTANHMWVPISVLEENTIIEQELAMSNEIKTHLGRIYLPRETCEEGRSVISYDYETWQKMVEYGDEWLVLYDIWRMTCMPNFGATSIGEETTRGLQSALSMFILHSNQCEFPHFSTHALRCLYNDYVDIQRVVLNIMKTRMQASAFDERPHELVNRIMKRYFHQTDPANFPHYMSNLKLLREQHAFKQISVEIGDISSSGMSIDIFHHGELPVGFGSHYRRYNNMRHVKRILYALQPSPCIVFDNIRSVLPSDYTTVLDAHTVWYNKDEYYQGDTCANVQLFHYQNMAVRQMLLKEQNARSLSNLLESNLNGMPYNLLTGSHTDTTIEPSSGGILSMDVGLGKTLCALGLYFASPMRTLVVVPLTLMDQWSKHIRRHLPDVCLTECYGRKKNTRGDIVLTTYNTVRTLYQKDEFLHGFSRVIFDESHTLSGISSVVTNACYFIRAPHRWCLTATPFTSNSFESIESQLKVLNVSPFGKYTGATSLLKDNIDNEHTTMREICIAQHLLTSCMIRITKTGLRSRGISFSDVDVRMHIVSSELDDALKSQYTYLKYLFHDRLVDSPSNRQYSRLMQFSDLMQISTIHPSLVPLHHYAHTIVTDTNVKTVEDVEKRMGNSAYDTEVKKTLENLDTTQCVICMDDMERPTITPCNHIFCNECIMQQLSHRSRCPMCRQVITASSLIEISPSSSEEVEEHGDQIVFKDIIGRKCQIDKKTYDKWHSDQMELLESPKFKAVDRIVNGTSSSVVIFSQFNVVLTALKNKFPNAEMITGRSTRKQRKDAIERFQQKTSSIFILSTKCASVGITLTSGSHLVFMEEMLDNSTKEQAIGRLARTGQMNHVDVHTLSSPGTCDTGIAALRERLAVGQSESGTRFRRKHKSLKTKGLLELFNIV